MIFIKITSQSLLEGMKLKLDEMNDFKLNDSKMFINVN
jgi:hypothetical protein